jgi:hypothetical protein
VDNNKKVYTTQCVNCPQWCEKQGNKVINKSYPQSSVDLGG